MLSTPNTTIRLPRPHLGQQYVLQHARRFNWLSAGRRWRKTTLAMSIVVEAAIRGGTYIWGAPTYDQVRIGLSEVKMAVGNVGKFNMSRMTAEIPQAGGIIVFRSLDNPDNVRGYTADGVVMDEAAFVKGDAWLNVLRPMLIDTGGWAWGIGTPKGNNWFHTEFLKAQDHDDYMAWQIPTRGVKVINGEIVPDPHPLENPDVPFSEIVQMWHSMPERIFEQEILGIFHTDAGGVFRRVMDAATATALDEMIGGRQYVMGIDWGRSNDFTVIAVVDMTTAALVYLDRFNQIDYTVQRGRVIAAYERFRPAQVIVEVNAMGQPVADELLRDGLPISGFTTTNASKARIIDNLALAFERGTIRILNDAILIGELQAYEMERTSGGLMRYGAPPGMHDDTVMALAMAWHGATDMPDMVQVTKYDQRNNVPIKRRKRPH